VLGVGHRVVHGGARYAGPCIVTPAVLDDLRELVPLAPLHQPYNIAAIEAVSEKLPGVPQVACFDTSFHRGQPAVAELVPLPKAIRDAGVQRYGFHGLSYEYIASALPDVAPDICDGRVIVAHLGSGASLCAMQGLQSVATTMGFSALDGLMMGTRCGALDPGVVLHLIGRERYSLERLEHLLYQESGLLGVSGLSPSPKVLLEAEDGNPQARLALDLYVRRIVREIGALTAALGGLDMLAFTAGVGENSAPLRARICNALGWLGVEVDADANRAGLPILSTAASRVCVVVERTNEEWIAASHAQRLIGMVTETFDDVQA
jgi:acetate kinase